MSRSNGKAHLDTGKVIAPERPGGREKKVPLCSPTANGLDWRDRFVVLEAEVTCPACAEKIAKPKLKTLAEAGVKLELIDTEDRGFGCRYGTLKRIHRNGAFIGYIGSEEGAWRIYRVDTDESYTFGDMRAGKAVPTQLGKPERGHALTYPRPAIHGRERDPGVHAFYSKWGALYAANALFLAGELISFDAYTEARLADLRETAEANIRRKAEDAADLAKLKATLEVLQGLRQANVDQLTTEQLEGLLDAEARLGRSLKRKEAA